MSSSTPSHKFLLDENVHRELFRFLKKLGLDVKLAPKSTPDRKIAVISKTEKRILVTNDEDFVEYSKNEIFAVIWLRIPQNDLKGLLLSFGELLDSTQNCAGKLVILKRNLWDVFDLGSWE